jgi:ATP/maltotriose-dependent transcriptional regulator MalT
MSLQACAIAKELGMIAPCVEQPEYNMFARRKVRTLFMFVNSVPVCSVSNGPQHCLASA